MTQTNLNIPIALNGKSKRNFSLTVKKHYNDLNSEFVDSRDSLVKSISQYWGMQNSISVLQKDEAEFKLTFGKAFEHLLEKDNSDVQPDDLPAIEDNSNTLLSPFMVIVVFVLLYFADLFLIRDTYLYLTADISSELVRFIVMLCLPAFMIGLYVILFSGMEKKKSQENKVLDNEFEFVGETNEVFVAKESYSILKLPKGRLLLNFLKFVPVISVVFSYAFVLFSSHHGVGYKIALFIGSLILVAIHLGAVEIFPRVLFSMQFFAYKRKLKAFSSKIDALHSQLNDVEVSIRKEAEQLKSTASRLREFNPDIDLPLPLSTKDEELLKSFGVDFSWAGIPK